MQVPSKKTLKIAMLQVPVKPEVPANIQWIKENGSNTSDVLILPEMWNCPYENEAMQKAVSYQEQSIAALQELSLKNNKSLLVAAFLIKKEIRSTICVLFLTKAAKLRIMPRCI